MACLARVPRDSTMAALWGLVTAWARAAYVGWFGYDRLPESADDLV